jgi:DNA-binding XRE family transcriptional regulator
MSPKNSTTNADVGVMLGPDGRIMAVVDFEYLVELATKAGEPVRTDSAAAFLKTSMKEFAAKRELEREDAIDIALAKAAMKEEALPLDIAKNLINGENPIRVYRKYRGLTQAELAKMVGSKAAYISQIETGVHTPGLKLVGKIAAALEVTIDDLVE